MQSQLSAEDLLPEIKSQLSAEEFAAGDAISAVGGGTFCRRCNLSCRRRDLLPEMQSQLSAEDFAAGDAILVVGQAVARGRKQRLL